MRCRLTKEHSVHQNLRTPVIEGGCDEPPRFGRPFRMHAPPLDPDADIRLVSTTPIVTLVPAEDDADVYVFETENSVYKWERLPNA